MKVSYLIETDWIIHYLIGTKHIQQELQRLRPEGLAVSIISLAEVYEGVYYSKDTAASQEGFEDFLSDMPILPVDEEVCKIFAKERGRLRKQGNIIGDFDLLIA
jgi:tRNA(fMet)-specific endonuclease VapC